jgi:23S rRNA (pseudouridine1915-N3)-methyltransferase
MRIVVLAVGRLRPPFEDDVAHYRKLLRGHARVEEIEVRDDDALPRRIPERCHLVALDARGTAMSSEALAAWLEARRHEGRDLCFAIGGAFGLDLPQAETRLSFGPMTLPHQLARVVLLEQLFRAHKILAGGPYHH